MAGQQTRPIEEPVSEVEVRCTINGEPVESIVPVRLLLTDFLRDGLRLTGTHVGCEQGVCGACTVLLDGSPVRACLLLASQVDGAEVTTIEGVTPADGLSPLQQAFKENHGLQCGFCTRGFCTRGFCTPGFIMTLSGVAAADYPDDEGMHEVLSGNLCRCTGYEGIRRTVRAAWGREGA